MLTILACDRRVLTIVVLNLLSATFLGWHHFNEALWMLFCVFSPFNTMSLLVLNRLSIHTLVIWTIIFHV